MTPVIRALIIKWGSILDISNPSVEFQRGVRMLLSDLESAVADDEGQELDVRVTHLRDVIKLAFEARAEAVMEKLDADSGPHAMLENDLDCMASGLYDGVMSNTAERVIEKMRARAEQNPSEQKETQ